MYGGGDGSAEALTNHIKDLQRKDPAAKANWVAFTDASGGGKQDPAKHSPEFLQSFLAQHQSGVSFQSMDTSSNLAESVKFMQRKSTSFRQIWGSFCTLHGGGKSDPMKKDNAFHEKFLDALAQQAGMAVGMDGSSMGPGDNPAKRMRDSSGMAMGTAGFGGGSQKDALVSRVKDYQRLGPEQKELWHTYADTFLQGVRDPSRQDAQVLQEFCDNHGVPQSSQSGGGGVGMGMGMSMGVGMSGGGGGAQKEALVSQVKNYQRMGQEQKDLWHTYADTFLQGVRDPSRHDASTLHEFCENHQVPPVAGGCGSSFGSLSSSMGTGPAGGSLFGGGGADPEMEGLVSRVKNFQRQGPENKETWYAFCGVMRDPAKKTKQELLEFCSMQGV